MLDACDFTVALSLDSGKPKTQLKDWSDYFLHTLYMFAHFFSYVYLQQFGKILDVEIIFNERGSKVSAQDTFLLLAVIFTLHVLPMQGQCITVNEPYTKLC